MTTLRTSTAVAAVIGACIAGIALPPTALADPPDKPEKSEAANPAAGQAGMRAYVDPETGQLSSRPATPADAAALNSEFQEDFSKIQEIHKADGSTEWIFNGQVDTALVARRSENGQIEMVCAEHGVVHDQLTAPVSQGGGDER